MYLTLISQYTYRDTINNGANGLKARLGYVDQLTSQGWWPHKQRDEAVKQYWQETHQWLSMAIQKVCHPEWVERGMDLFIYQLMAMYAFSHHRMQFTGEKQLKKRWGGVLTAAP